jgi:hypothetical protein
MEFRSQSLKNKENGPISRNKQWSKEATSLFYRKLTGLQTKDKGVLDRMDVQSGKFLKKKKKHGPHSVLTKLTG